MSIFSYHIVRTSYVSAVRINFKPPKPSDVAGLIHAECMNCMTLGAKLYSPSRILFRNMVLFAQWENETAINHFLKTHSSGKIFAKGWHTRLSFLRQWGSISGFKIPENSIELHEMDAPVVAVTLARMKFLEIPRFIRWGRPVEKLVRDHPGTILSLASIRFPRTVSTFSIWKTQKEMVDMVHGRSDVPQPERHIHAMKERDRKDFHFEFTTLRFTSLSESGEWKGHSHIIPSPIRQ